MIFPYTPRSAYIVEDTLSRPSLPSPYPLPIAIPPGGQMSEVSEVPEAQQDK